MWLPARACWKVGAHAQGADALLWSNPSCCSTLLMAHQSRNVAVNGASTAAHPTFPLPFFCCFRLQPLMQYFTMLATRKATVDVQGSGRTPFPETQMGEQTVDGVQGC